MVKPTVDVVIIHHNTLDLTSRCIRSLLETAADSIASITVVDNASTDDSGNHLSAQFPGIDVVRCEQLRSYAAACNEGTRRGNAPYVLLSNSDVEYSPDCIERLIEHMEQHPYVGVCCPNQRYADGRRQRSWGYFPGWSEIAASLSGIETIHNRRGHADIKPRAVPYCDGAVLLCRRTAYEDIGGMDERFWFFCEDADLCYRLWRQQWHCHFVPSASVLHHRGGTRQQSDDRTIAFEQQNMAAKLLFSHIHRLPLRRFIPLGYALALTFLRMGNAIVRTASRGTPKQPDDRLLRKTRIDYLLQRYADRHQHLP